MTAGVVDFKDENLEENDNSIKIKSRINGFIKFFTGYSFWDRLRNFYTNLHELFCQLISWTKRVNSGKFIGNCWISCLVMADIKKVYNDLLDYESTNLFNENECCYLYQQ